MATTTNWTENTNASTTWSVTSWDPAGSSWDSSTSHQNMMKLWRWRVICIPKQNPQNSTSSLPVPSSRTGSVWPGWFWVGLTEQQADEPKLHDVRMSTKRWCDQPKVQLHRFLSAPSLHRGCSQNQRFGFDPLHSLPAVTTTLLQIFSWSYLWFPIEWKQLLWTPVSKREEHYVVFKVEAGVCRFCDTIWWLCVERLLLWRREKD